MIQAIFFDVDGTLVSFRTHTIPASTLEALHALRAKGIKLFLATGRHQAMLRSVQELFPFDGCVTLSGQYCFVGDQVLRSSPMPPEAVLATGRHQAMLRSVQELFPFDGCVTLSGQYCFVGDQVLRSSPMPPEAVEELVSAAEGDAFSSIFLEGEDIYLNCINDLTRQFIRELYIPMPPVRPARYALGREIYQAVTFLSREQEHLLLDRAPHLKTTRWHPNFLDVIPPTGGKDLGMDAILKHFNIPVENCMAFGDGENDLSMLIHAGIGVAMGTASGAVKAQADYTAPSVDEDGVARTLSHFGLLP